MLLQGAHLLTKKVSANGDSLRAEINTEAIGEFCKSISPFFMPFFIHIHTTFIVVLHGYSALERY